MEQIFGTVERITFQNSENGFTVLRLLMPRKKELTTVVGKLPPVQPGETIRCMGTWKNNNTHGLQFEASSCHVEQPSDLIGIKKYLASGMIRGIGAGFAEKIVKCFGLKTLDIIEHQPEELAQIEGLGSKRIERITACWQEQKSVRSIMIFLQKYEISPRFAHKIFRYYGSEAINKVQENPYDLARLIPGIGFKMADKIAEKMGFSKNSALRIASAIEFLLSELSSDGHVCYPLSLFLEFAKETLNVEIVEIENQITNLIAEERVVLGELADGSRAIWLKRLYLAESGLAKQLMRLCKATSPLRKIDPEKAVEWVEKQLHIELAPNQQEAVKKATCDKVHIITGGPGTGKSTITKAILAITSKLTRKIILAAPTGRAAKRMTEITRRDAQTIHSLLKYDFKGGGFKMNAENPLDCDLIIIDEASMIDTPLMYHLLKAIPTSARVLFVGDIHQLPSVGPGNVLKDMIDSNALPVTTLNKIFRQAAGSKIITNAHRINEGRLPDLHAHEKSDFLFVEAQEGEDALKAILTQVSEKIPQSHRFDKIDDIQVLTPMKKGIIGSHNLNVALQELLNPQKEFFMHSGRRFAIGDKVMQIKNNYNKEVYNGDIGRVVSIDVEDQEIVISYDGKEVLYAANELEEVTLAYATSIHKYQGSECKCVVIPIHTSHFVMLHRNLLYTAVTRGKKLVVLVGTVKALAIAVGNDEVKKRYTCLAKHLTS